jgi:hypothetical protein
VGSSKHLSNKVSKSYGDGIFSQNGHYDEESSDCKCHYLKLKHEDIEHVERNARY